MSRSATTATGLERRMGAAEAGRVQVSEYRAPCMCGAVVTARSLFSVSGVPCLMSCSCAS